MVVSTTFDGDQRKAYDDMVGIEWAEAQRQQGLTEDDLTLRDLLPGEDCNVGNVQGFGNNYEDWLFTTATTTAATITYLLFTVDTARFLGFNAVGFGGSAGSLRNIAQLKVTRGGKVLRRWQLQPWVEHAAISSSDSAGFIADGRGSVLYMDDPVTAFQRIPVQVDVIRVNSAGNRAGGITATIALLGRVVEPEGKVVNRIPSILA